MMLHVLNDDDGIIDNQADGKHHGEKCQCIDGKIQDDEGAKGTNQGYRHREKRDDRRADILQEDKDDKHHQQQRLNKGLHHFLDGGTDVIRAVHDRVHLEIRREILFRLIQDIPNFLDGLHGICITGKLDAEAHRRIIIRLGNDIVRLLP